MNKNVLLALPRFACLQGGRQGGAPMKTSKVMEGPRDGEVRCFTCFERFRPEAGAERAKCPKCGTEWRISWPYPKTARVRGPVWENYPLGTDDKI
jgi:predicted RNA-binding Zn-ribbon protein involved in translation (DUF1610 family)